MRQGDAAGGEEIPHARVTGLAVQVAPVVLPGIEGAEFLLPTSGAPGQIDIEQLLPRRGMEGCGIGYDPVRIEDTRLHPLEPGENLSAGIIRNGSPSRFSSIVRLLATKGPPLRRKRFTRIGFRGGFAPAGRRARSCRPESQAIWREWLCGILMPSISGGIIHPFKVFSGRKTHSPPPATLVHLRWSH